MGTHRQTLLYDLTTFVTLLAGEARVHSYHLVTGSCSLILKDVKERAPTGVHDALRQVMVFHHIVNLKVFYCYVVIAFSIGFRRLKMMISALAIDLEVCLCDVSGSLALAMTPFLTAAKLTLFASKRLLRGAIEAWVLNRIALAISEEGFESCINTNVRMLTFRGKMFRLWLRLTDDERVPMSISPQNKIDRFGSSF